MAPKKTVADYQGFSKPFFAKQNDRLTFAPAFEKHGAIAQPVRAYDS